MGMGSLKLGMGPSATSRAWCLVETTTSLLHGLTLHVALDPQVSAAGAGGRARGRGQGSGQGAGLGAGGRARGRGQRWRQG